MIIIIENGKLGNQLFQYFYCKSIASNKEKIFLFGFDELKELIEDDQLFFFVSNNTILYKILIKLKRRVDNFLLKYKLFNFIYESSDLNKENIYKGQGVFSRITYISGFFQNETFIKKKILNNFRIKNYLTDKAKKNISRIKKNENTKIIFIHLRGKDYKFWPSKKFPAVLPINWYIKCIKKFKLIFEDKKVFFLFFTDDKKYFFKNKFFNKNFIFIKSNLSNDFLTMSLCDGGILSPSSYAWWSAFLSFSKNKNRIFFAPKYWIGHRLKQYFPKNIKYTSFLKYINVSRSDYLL